MTETADQFKAKGNAALTAKDFPEAIAMYTKAIELDDTNHVFFSNRSAAYLQNGDPEAALADGEKCIGAKPDWPKAYSRKGAALHAMKKYDEAEATYKAGLEKCPGDETLKAALQQVEEVQAKQASAAASPFGNIMGKLAGHPMFSTWMSDPVMMQKITMLQQNPNLALQSAIGDPTMHPVLEAALGIKLGSPGDMAPAKANIGSPGDMAPAKANIGSPGDMGMAPTRSQNPGPDSAAPAAPAAPAAAPAAPAAPKELSEEEKAAAAVAEVRARGNKHYAAKEFTEALACYDQVLEEDPQQVSVLNNKAAVFMEMGDLDGAEAQCKEAVEKAQALRPTPFDLIAKIYVRWGKVHVKRKDLGMAIEYYNKAQMEFHTKETERLLKTTQLEKKKQDKLAYIDPAKAAEAKERGNTAFRAQEWGNAIKEYEEAIKRDPKEPSYHNNLAATLCKVMDFQGAKREVDEALELDDKYVKAWSRKGDIEFLQKEYHKAMESYQKGLSLEEGNKSCMEGLQKTMRQINAGTSAMSDDEKKERAAHGMADPEVQAILTDPMVRQVIQDLSTNDPTAQAAGQKALRDPIMGAKIQKLIAAGVLQTG